MPYTRLFGRDDYGSVNPDEAQHIRDTADALISGALRVRGAVARWNAAGLRTSQGNPWNPTTLRRLLLNRRLTEARPILTTEKQDQLAAALAAYSASHRRGRPAGTSMYLCGAQALLCGKCGSFLAAAGRAAGEYRCPQGGVSPRGGPSCANTFIRIDLADQWVREATLNVIEAEGVRLPGVAGTPPELAQAKAAVEAHEQMRQAGVYADALEARRIGARAKRRLIAVKRELDAAGNNLTRRAGSGAGDWFDSLDIRDQQRVIAAIWEPIVVAAGKSNDRLTFTRKSSDKLQLAGQHR